MKSNPICKFKEITFPKILGQASLKEHGLIASDFKPCEILISEESSLFLSLHLMNFTAEKLYCWEDIKGTLLVLNMVRNHLTEEIEILYLTYVECMLLKGTK